MTGVSGRMGEQGGLRTGWLAAFGTEGYDGEPGLMEELGVNFGHIKTKVRIQYIPGLAASEQVH
jgi:protein YIPF5/7